MGVVVAFNYDAFVARYPEFGAVSESLVLAYWTEATIYHSNSGSGPVVDAPTQSMLLNMVTAHIAWINRPENEIVGRISSASQGSVSVSTQNDYAPGSPQWWQQTKYGGSYWSATAQFRNMRWRPGFSRRVSPFSPFRR